VAAVRVLVIKLLRPVEGYLAILPALAVARAEYSSLVIGRPLERKSAAEASCALLRTPETWAAVGSVVYRLRPEHDAPKGTRLGAFAPSWARLPRLNVLLRNCSLLKC